jgi:NADH-ubiquinone oxidoreductase chain 5
LKSSEGNGDHPLRLRLTSLREEKGSQGVVCLRRVVKRKKKNLSSLGDANERTMYLLIVVLPLMGAILGGFFGVKIGEKGAVILTTTLVGLTALLSLIAFYEVGFCGNPVSLKVCKWIESDLFSVDWGFLFDSLTVVMLVVITVVSTLVHLYSSEYMDGDPHRPRFMSYLSLFTFFMVILVTADNYLQMFVGWEGVGLCSYLLINFWYTRIQANKAAIQAMLVNRVGDFALCLGIMGIFYVYGAIDYETVFSSGPMVLENTTAPVSGETILAGICLLLFIGAVGKSAQLGLHTWLPNAMEGPTPVSALIHAATMVTAGVFLLARSSPLFEYSPMALTVVTVVGAMTAFFAATTGLLQNDLKKVIAYSTCSQLGYMIFGCGLSAYSVGVFHLANHGFFKALLFLSAGSVIHAMADEQDMRRMGGLVKLLPLTYAMIFIGSLALMGFPFLTGFYSKDVLLEVAYASYNLPGHFAYWLGSLGAFFTAFYSMRLLYLTFLSKTNSYIRVIEHAHEPSWPMTLPLLILCVGSIFVGYVTKDLLIGVGTDFWSHAIFSHPKNLKLLDAEFLPHTIKLLPVALSILGATSSFFLYTFFVENLFAWKVENSFGRKIYTFLNGKWFFDKVYTELFVQTALDHGYHKTYKMVDRGIIEILGPYGISQTLYEKAFWLSRFQTGHLFHYTLLMILGITIILAGLLLSLGASFLSLTPIFTNKLFFIFIILTVIWKGRNIFTLHL